MVEIPEGSGNLYRYGYDPFSKATRYLGPIGDTPPLSEEEFFTHLKTYSMKDFLEGVPDEEPTFGDVDGISPGELNREKVHLEPRTLFKWESYFEKGDRFDKEDLGRTVWRKVPMNINDMHDLPRGYLISDEGNEIVVSPNEPVNEKTLPLEYREFKRYRLIEASDDKPPAITEPYWIEVDSWRDWTDDSLRARGYRHYLRDVWIPFKEKMGDDAFPWLINQREWRDIDNFSLSQLPVYEDVRDNWTTVDTSGKRTGRRKSDYTIYLADGSIAPHKRTYESSSGVRWDEMWWVKEPYRIVKRDSKSGISEWWVGKEPDIEDDIIAQLMAGKKIQL